MNQDRKPRTLAEVNKAIQKKYPKVILVKGRGYFYISSNDNEMALKIARLYTTSIPVCKLSQLTIEQWVNDVESLLKDTCQPPGGIEISVIDTVTNNREKLLARLAAGVSEELQKELDYHMEIKHVDRDWETVSITDISIPPGG